MSSYNQKQASKCALKGRSSDLCVHFVLSYFPCINLLRSHVFRSDHRCLCWLVAAATSWTNDELHLQSERLLWGPN